MRQMWMADRLFASGKIRFGYSNTMYLRSGLRLAGAGFFGLFPHSNHSQTAVGVITERSTHLKHGVPEQ